MVQLGCLRALGTRGGRLTQRLRLGPTHRYCVPCHRLVARSPAHPCSTACSNRLPEFVAGTRARCRWTWWRPATCPAWTPSAPVSEAAVCVVVWWSGGRVVALSPPNTRHNPSTRSRTSAPNLLKPASTPTPPHTRTPTHPTLTPPPPTPLLLHLPAADAFLEMWTMVDPKHAAVRGSGTQRVL